MTVRIHPSWLAVLSSEFEKDYWQELTSFIKREYSQKTCFPEGKNIFRAFDLTPFESVKVVILGQDPYHTAYMTSRSKLSAISEERNIFSPQSSHELSPVCAAMGLSFSVPNGSKPQPSLANIFKELESDIGSKRTTTNLSDWAEQGVLLLNSVLTVRQGEAASHKGKGWEIFTDSAIKALSDSREGIVFILWGNYAIAKKTLIDTKKHHIITSPHPSPFSAYNGFFGSKPFSKTNEYLEENGYEAINW